MEEAGVPILPGSSGIESQSELENAAERIGFPIILKAAAGGGGRGMKIVEGPARLGPAPRHHHGADVRRLEDPEGCRSEVGGEVDQFEAEPEVRLVDAEAAEAARGHRADLEVREVVAEGHLLDVDLVAHQIGERRERRGVGTGDGEVDEWQKQKAAADADATDATATAIIAAVEATTAAAMASISAVA